MTRSYSPHKFLRQAPADLLRLFFERLGLFGEFPWAQFEGHIIGPLQEEWLKLSDGRREQVESLFRDIDEVATEPGVQAVIDEARFDDIDLAPRLAELEGHHHKALWVFLQYPEVFQNAFRFVHADALPGRYWRKRKGLPKKPPDLSPLATHKMQGSLSTYYRENQGRGHRCTVEHFLRAGRQHYFFVYLDDYADTYIGHEGTGQLVRRPSDPRSRSSSCSTRRRAPSSCSRRGTNNSGLS